MLQMKTTIEKNRMLLNFMRVYPIKLSETTYHYSDAPFFYCSKNTREEVLDAMAEYAKYDSDWSWLMKVVDKLCHLKIGDGEKTVEYAHPYTFGMLSEDGKIMVRLHGFPLHLADTLIEATYEAVCEVVEHITQNELI